MDGSLVLRKIGLLLGCWEKQAAATPWLTFWEGNLALWSFSINSHRVRISPPPDVCWRSDPSLGDAGGATGHKVSALSAFPSLSNKASLWAQCCVLGCLLWARAFPKQLGWSGVLEVLGELLERCCGLSSPVTASVCRGGNLWRLEFFIFIFIYFLGGKTCMCNRKTHICRGMYSHVVAECLSDRPGSQNLYLYSAAFDFFGEYKYSLIS